MESGKHELASAQVKTEITGTNLQEFSFGYLSSNMLESIPPTKFTMLSLLCMIDHNLSINKLVMCLYLRADIGRYGEN